MVDGMIGDAWSTMLVMFGMLYQNEIRMIFDVCENEKILR